MIHNNIKVRRIAMGIRQSDLAMELRDAASASVISGIESGRTMPTRTDMRTLCELLHCVPGDLYAPEELDLSGNAGYSRNDRKGRCSTEIRVRIPPEEKRELIEAVAYLGYRDTSDWLQQMRKRTVERYKRKLEKALAAIQTVVSPQTVGNSHSNEKPLKNVSSAFEAKKEEAAGDADTSSQRQGNNCNPNITQSGEMVNRARKTRADEAPMCLQAARPRDDAEMG